MFLRQLQLGPMENFVYLVGDPETKECAVVDPGWDAPAVLEAAVAGGYGIAMVLLTHGHRDHTGAVGELLRARPVPVYVHERDSAGFEDLGQALERTVDGQKISLGRTTVTCLHTPGHTPGSQCFVAGGFLFTGDTLFIRECGRVDLPGSDPEAFYHSLRKLAGLQEPLTVYPGHHYGPKESATLAEEREKNPYLRACRRSGVDEFRDLVL